MTQKFTAEEVRREAAGLKAHGYVAGPAMLNAYAEELRAALAAQGRGEAVNGDAPCAKCGSTSVDTGFECNDCGHDNAPPASPAGVPEVLAKLYAAASKGFHTSETCGPESKYLHKSKFQTMQELFDFEDAWRQAMLAAAPSAPEGDGGEG